MYMKRENIFQCSDELVCRISFESINSEREDQGGVQLHKRCENEVISGRAEKSEINTLYFSQATETNRLFLKKKEKKTYIGYGRY